MKIRFIILMITVSLFLSICLSQNRSEVTREMIELSEPDVTGNMSLEKALSQRRSVRQFSDKPVSEKKLSQLLWAGQGITEKSRGFRTAPSAGALYPLKLFAVNSKGVFEYIPEGHKMVKRIDRNVKGALAKAALGQSWVKEAALNIIIAGDEKILATKYGGRAKRYMLLEAGHAAQNILLQATSLDLGSVPVGAFSIRSVEKLLNLQNDFKPLYIICIGQDKD